MVGETKLTGAQRRQVILDTAEDLIAEEGYAAFTARRVAAIVDIKLASLQYYFPTRGDLLKAVMENIVARYKDKALSEVVDMTVSPSIRFATIIRWFLEDIRTNSKTSRLFPQLWALAGHNDQARDALDDLMIAYRQQLGQWMSEVNPALSSAECEARCAVLTALIEGMTIIVGEGKPRHTATTGLDDTIVEMALDLAQRPAKSHDEV